MGGLYIGEYERAVDGKGRLALPSPQLSSMLQNDDSTEVVIIRGEEKCIYLYDVDTWQEIIKKVRNELNYDEIRLLMHHAMSDVYTSRIDGQGRILIPVNLRQYAAVTDRATIVGAFNRIEIWNPEEWLAYLDALEDVPQPSISQFSRPRLREVTANKQGGRAV